MWEKDSFTIGEIMEELNLTDAQIRIILSKMQDRVDNFSEKLRNGERRLNNLEVTVIEFVHARTNKERIQDDACDLAVSIFYRDNKPRIIKEYLETELQRIGETE
ncbi:hypothetical protein FH508_0014860 [Lysinibacillus sp. CD3-6]|uniref:hypothetical protein n=1 Tax=Lysinibacillus sp. CD3-6 TaxID=2892541 RepID=UPI0011701AE6|nr:hypothetical protein [Lysinibacillus sp. CD3-6]UED78732.1 hypothetical protein FH508_0014860 [Lysinibacillus sp. CD3-6]